MPIEEQLFRKMAILFDQKQRQGVAKIGRGRRTQEFKTRTFNPFLHPESISYYTTCFLDNAQCALPASEAEALIVSKSPGTRSGREATRIVDDDEPDELLNKKKRGRPAKKKPSG